MHPLRVTLFVSLAVAAVVSVAFGYALRGLRVPDGEVVILSAVVFLVFLVPWTAVNLVDYFFVRRGRYAITHLFMPHGIYGEWGARGLTAYVVGFIATLPFFVLPDVYTGPVARVLGGIDIGWLVGLLVSGSCYFLLCKSLDVSFESVAIAESEQALRALEVGT